MFNSLQSLLGRWRDRLFGRTFAVHEEQPAQPAPLPESETPASPEPVVEQQPKPAGAVSVSVVNADELKQALAETVMSATTSGLVKARSADPAIRRENTLKELTALKQIPSLQSFAKGFIMSASRDYLAADELVESIEKDPALCVRVLRLANSAYIGPARHIDDLLSAVQMLGVQRIRTLMQALYTLRDARAIAPGFDWHHLWMHALATADLAEELEYQLGLRNVPMLYLSGLLHDVGKIVLSVLAPEEYRDVMILAWQESRPLEEMELDRFGVTHREAGRIFLFENNMAEVVVASAEFHRDPSEAPKEHCLTVALVSVANHISKAYGLGFSGSALTEADGELLDLPAWQVIAEEIGRTPNLTNLEEEIRAYLPGLKATLRGLR